MSDGCLWYVCWMFVGHGYFMASQMHSFCSFFKICSFKNYHFVFFFIFYNLKRIKSNSLLTVWYALRPSQQPNVTRNYSESIIINIRPSYSRIIVSTTHHPMVLGVMTPYIEDCLIYGLLIFSTDQIYNEEKRAQDEPKFTCSFCDKPFCYKDTLDEHSIKVHKGKIVRQIFLKLTHVYHARIIWFFPVNQPAHDTARTPISDRDPMSDAPPSKKFEASSNSVYEEG